MADRRPEPPPQDNNIENGRRQRRRAQDVLPQEPAQQQQQPPVDAANLPIPVRPGADLTYPELLQYPAQDPIREDPYQPDLQRAQLNPTHVEVWDYTTGERIDHHHRADEDGPPPISLIPSAGGTTSHHPTHAYAWLPGMKEIQLQHAHGWGTVRFAVVYPHQDGDPPHVFRTPPPGQEESLYVAVKMLNKAVVQEYLEKNGPENPYKEICRYQELGDNVHVIRCEALEDDEHLYIITPKCRRLVDVIFGGGSGQQLQPAQVHAYFLQMLRILCYLEEHDIHHRDLSPDNLFILPNGRLVLVDFAMSLRIPRTNKKKKSNGDNNDNTTDEGGEETLRTLIRTVGNFGTPSWMAPEIYHRFPFDGVASDLWCVMHIFYNLVATDILYRRPEPADWCYRFFVLASGLTSDTMNEQAMEVLQEVAEEAEDAVQQRIQRMAIAHLAFPPPVRNLLHHTLQNAPHERWTLGQVLRSDYVVHGP